MKSSGLLLTLLVMSVPTRSAAFVVGGLTITPRSHDRSSISGGTRSLPALRVMEDTTSGERHGFQNQSVLTATAAALLLAGLATTQSNNFLDDSSRLLDYAYDMIQSNDFGVSLLPMINSLGTAALGVTIVSTVANMVDQMTVVPPYDPNGQRFDQTHFGGRFCHMLLACDPRLLLYNQHDVRSLQSLLAQHDEQSSAAISTATTQQQDRILWDAKRVSESALHPETGAWIPRPFRMSGYLPYNGPICIAMLLSQSTLALLVWSWINQSQNALVNYYNRNAASEDDDDMSTLWNSYIIAVGSALTVAFGLVTLVEQNFDAETTKTMLQWIPFPSAVVASSLNCFIVRSPELESGIPLLNEQGNVLIAADGHRCYSQQAAKRGVLFTTASRAILQTPVYLLPPLLLETSPVLKSYLIQHPSLSIPVTTFLLLTSFGFGLPAAVAIFPQRGKISSHDVEPKFQHTLIIDPATNQPYQDFYYNKGL